MAYASFCCFGWFFVPCWFLRTTEKKNVIIINEYIDIYIFLAKQNEFQTDLKTINRQTKQATGMHVHITLVDIH